MLSYHRTSILTSTAQTVVNTVNTVGVMGKGLAAAFKARAPEMFHEYQHLCQNGKLKIGTLWLWKGQPQWILNFPTKKHWRNPSQLSYIESGLAKFVAQYEQRGIREISFPRLGCGNGGLNWKDVRPLMESYLAKLPISVYIHDYEKDIGYPEHRDTEGGVPFERSFIYFKEQMLGVVKANQGLFRTLANKSSFRVSYDLAKGLRIERDGSREFVSNSEIFELWTLLLRGPVNRERLAGNARNSAYYLFPIVAQMPFARAIEIAGRDDKAALAIELVPSLSSKDVSAPPAAKQSTFEWH